MHFDAEFWDFVAFITFIGLLGYFGLYKKMGIALDARGARVKAQIDEAIALRKEAEELLASFVRKKKEAEDEAKAIIAQAQVEAELIAKDAHERVADFVQRRTKQAEDKSPRLKPKRLRRSATRPPMQRPKPRRSCSNRRPRAPMATRLSNRAFPASSGCCIEGCTSWARRVSSRKRVRAALKRSRSHG